MLKKLTLIAVCAFYFMTLKAQTPACTPNLLYKDSSSGVYPSPRTTGNPNGGINKAACLSTAYNFVFTIKVDTTITVSSVTLSLDSVTLATSGAIQGLPGGLSYACNPPNCVFKRKTIGCAIIQGIIADTDKVKDYPLVITGKACVGFLGCVAQTFPSSSFPGDYTITVLAKGSSKCTTPTEEVRQLVTGLKVQPNPASDAIRISFNVQQAGEYVFRVINVLGATVIENKTVFVAGENELSLNIPQLNNGLYIYSLSKDNQTISEKLVVNK